MKNLKVATTELYARRYALGIGFFLILLIPGILIANFLIGGAASVFLFGALPVAVAFFGGTRKQSLLVLAFMTVAGTLARAFDGSEARSVAR